MALEDLIRVLQNVACKEPLSQEVIMRQVYGPDELLSWETIEGFLLRYRVTVHTWTMLTTLPTPAHTDGYFGRLGFIPLTTPPNVIIEPEQVEWRYELTTARDSLRRVYTDLIRMHHNVAFKGSYG